jgi:V/A-type H+/Na+-transporting ATPase subunit E
MSMQVQELIDKIKQEGVAAAEREAEKIVAAAEEKAARLVRQARSEAEAYKAQAEKEIKKQEAASRDALKQAARDILIGLKKQITAQFEAVLADSVEDVLTAELTEKLILNLVNAWAAEGEAGLQVVLSSRDAKNLGAALKEKLAQRFREGVEIVPSPKVSKGFRIGGSDGGLYNFTAEGIAEVLGETLSAELAGTLREAL